MALKCEKSKLIYEYEHRFDFLDLCFDDEKMKWIARIRMCPSELWRMQFGTTCREIARFEDNDGYDALMNAFEYITKNYSIKMVLYTLFSRSD